MPRIFQSPDSVVASKRIQRGKSTRGTKNVSTVSSKGGPRRYLTVGGTPTITQPTKRARAEREATKVRSSLSRVRRAYESGPNYGKTFDPDEAASLVRSVGGTKAEARALSTKIVGESGGRPGAIGHDPGGTTGLGLWQMTTGVGNDDLIAKHGGPKAMLKPKPNAKAALELYRGGGIGNWYAPSNPPGNPRKVPPKIKPAKKDLETLRKAGVEPRRANKKPFKKATAKSQASKNAAKIINPKWDPDDDSHGQTFLAKGISPVVKRWSKKYDVLVGEAKADSGHVSPGHLQQGTATDLYPKDDSEAGWDKLERGLKVLEAQGFEVGYGTNGVGQAWANHGRGNHAHVEWVGQGSSEDAIQKLAGLTDAELAKIESGVGSGGTSFTTSGGGTSSGASTSSGGEPAKKKMTRKQKLAKVRARFADTGTSESSDDTLAILARRYGSPAI